MKRLRDERGAADPVLAEAARLLSSRAPLADDPARRQRVRARMRRRRGAPAGAAWMRALAVVLLVFSVAAASAMIGHVAQTIRAKLQAARVAKQERERQRTHGHRSTPVAPPTAPTAPAAPTPATAPAPPTAPTPALIPTPAVAPKPLALPARAAATTPSLAPKPSPPPHRALPAPAASDPESDQARLVADAVRALRHQHDPARAAILLERYLDRYPDGVAAEDALALALEATIGRDAPRAAGFATRYLARYPGGRWSALAERALSP